MNKKINDEAKAFNDRITERYHHGFIPDLRRLTENKYFYKSFWRHPHYIDLYIGEMLRTYLEFLNKYCTTTGARILDIGCGAGYFSLELARNGFNVVGIDISEDCINLAKQTHSENKFQENFGSLEYLVGSYESICDTGEYDVVLSSGFLHHIPHLEEALKNIFMSMSKNGILIWHEPQHQKWTINDAGIVTIIRLLLSEFGFWYEDKLSALSTEKDLEKLTNSIFNEYIYERDSDETEGQSPNDLSCDGDEIIHEINKLYDILELKPSYSFIYRLLGGLRGDDQDKLNHIASILALVDKYYCKNEVFNANYFYGVAKKR